jgi:rare lipoprotein A
MARSTRSIAAVAVLALAQPGCATAEVGETGQPVEEPRIEKLDAPTPAPQARKSAAETGTATWYGPGLEGKPTASGERFSGDAMTAAHKTLPFGTRVRVTTLDTLTSVIVTINDRLPAASRHIIDLSQAAGKVLKMIGAGIARVRVEILE